MTIKTLTYIHDLMCEELTKRKDAYNYIREVANKAIDEEAPNAQFLSTQRDTAWQKYIEATNALADFEAKEW